MANLTDRIHQADSDEIELIIDALLSRHAILYPNWELAIIALNKTTDLNTQIDQTILLLQGFKEKRPDCNSFSKCMEEKKDFIYLLDND